MKLVIILMTIVLLSCAKQKTQPLSVDYEPMIKSTDSDVRFIANNINGKFDDNVYYKLAKEYKENQRQDFAKLQIAVKNNIYTQKNINFDNLKTKALMRINNELKIITDANNKLSKVLAVSRDFRPATHVSSPEGYEAFGVKINKMNYIFNIAHKSLSTSEPAKDLFENILSKNFLTTLFEPNEAEIGLFHDSDNRMNLSITANSIFLLSVLYDLNVSEYNKIVKSIPTIVFFYKTNSNYFDKNSMLFFEKQFPLIHNGYSFGGGGTFAKNKNIGANFSKEPHDCSEAISYIMLKDAGIDQKISCSSYFSTYDFLNLYRIKKTNSTYVDYQALMIKSKYYYLNRYFDILDIADIGIEGLKNGDILVWRIGTKNILSKTLGESGHTVVYLGGDGDRIYGLQHGRHIEDFGVSGYGIAVYSYQKLINSDKIFTMVVRKKQNIKSIKEVDEYYDKINKCQ